METSALMLASVLGPVYLVLGLSHLLYANVWVGIFKKWQKDHHSLVGLMIFVGVAGLLIVKMYNVWAWDLWLLVTLSGWAMVVKSVGYFLLPGALLKPLFALGEKAGFQYLAGLIATVIGLALVYYGYFVY